MKDVLISVLPFAMGLLALSCGVTLIVRRLRAKHSGMKLMATVTAETTRQDGRGLQSYQARVRFQAPDGAWMEQPAQATTRASRLGKAVSVWYTPGKRIWVDDPTFTRKVALFVGGALFTFLVGASLLLGH
ncbi:MULTISPECIES: DUF3592 domain-containing protein [unclassified Mycolicibacterium]|uniref:DUF3592 domain-containing protein n=1 Tax=unclassified Mycolicibacterium TaxID=2636767 RepID=UPI002EDAB008